ncbi:PIN domain-containing protein [Duganella sp. SG902]|uniref:type II toxin-antitoxin system VapC family toxin n=1 Tax=Duganella sp. SG902 TaxID=2587016 RepID=UPI00159E2698
MPVLLDTHVVLWWLRNDRKLSPHCRARIKSASAAYVNSVSIWEAAIKVSRGRLRWIWMLLTADRVLAEYSALIELV